jgi:hypothetical protein
VGYGQTPPSRPNLGAAVVAGLVAGVAGAVLWGGFTAVTHLRIGLVAIGVGGLVAHAVTKIGRGRNEQFGVVAAIITLLACAAGDVGSFYLEVSHDTHTSVSTVMRIEGPLSVLKNDVSHNAFGLVFFAIAAFYAYRNASGGPANLRTRRGPPPTYPPPLTPPLDAPSSYPPPTYGLPPDNDPPDTGHRTVS